MYTPHPQVNIGVPNTPRRDILWYTQTHPNYLNGDYSHIFTGWWFGTWILFFHIFGMSSSQLLLTHIFQRVQPPTSSDVFFFVFPSGSLREIMAMSSRRRSGLGRPQGCDLDRPDPSLLDSDPTTPHRMSSSKHEKDRELEISPS